MWVVLIISHILLKKGSNWYMDTGVHDLKVVFFKANSPDFFNVFYRILSFSAVSQSFKKICVWEIFGARTSLNH